MGIALFTFWGKVMHGKKRGKLLGYPTANVPLHKHIPEGIYASQVKIASQHFFSVTFIGAAKTFNEKDVKAETYIFDFDKNIYGQWITVMLYKKLRDNKTFSSEKALTIQIKKDIDNAKNFLSTTLLAQML